MTFVHLSLLAGGVLIAVPIILHLIMRRKPTRVEFPALRFVQKRHDANRRRLRLRHLLLLLLRAAAIALLAFALARPSIRLGAAGISQEAPVAAALVFDTAPHMDYRHENHTRLEEARDFGLWLLKQLPEQSDIAVLDMRPGTEAAFQPDRGAAKDRISRLKETMPNSQPLLTVLDEAAKLLKKSEWPRKEIYVFTDLARGAWPRQQAAAFQQDVAALGDCGVHVIDVGIANPANCTLGEVHLSAEILSNRSTLSIQTEVTTTSPAALRSVELYMFDADRKEQKRGEQAVQATPGEARPVEFPLTGLEPGVHQGYLRIVGQDGLAADDKRYFTVQIKPAWRILLAAPKPAEHYTWYLSQALAPDELRKRGQAKFDYDICDLGELTKRALAEYSAVCLVDPTPLEPATWKRLADFAADGHGVGIFLGRNAVPIESFNDPQAQELLPGKLLRQARRPDGDPVSLAPQDLQHPILAPFRSVAGAVPWEYLYVFRYWELDPPAKGASVVLPFSDGRPALLERSLGQGRALTMTTPVSDRLNENPWNVLPASDESWPFVILAQQIGSYLVGSGNQQLNYLAGQTAVLQLDAAARRRGFLLTAPDGTSFPISVDLNRRQWVSPPAENVGNYRLQAGSGGGGDLGFSVNYAPEQTDLERLGERELTELFGPVKFRLARTHEEIDRAVSQGRVGRELYPPLILIVAIVLALEMITANRFYKE